MEEIRPERDTWLKIPKVINDCYIYIYISLSWLLVAVRGKLIRFMIMHSMILIISLTLSIIMHRP